MTTITSLFLYSDSSAEVTIKEETGESTTLKLSPEKFKDMSLDQRFEAVKERANRYISCVEGVNIPFVLIDKTVENEVVSDLPFKE